MNLDKIPGIINLDILPGKMLKPSIFGEMPELAEGARLEIVCTLKKCTEGSNPSLSAIFHFGLPNAPVSGQIVFISYFSLADTL